MVIPFDPSSSSLSDPYKPPKYNHTIISNLLTKATTQQAHNGRAFTVVIVKEWLKALGVKTAHIELGSPWENGYNESFNGKLRDELLNREVFNILKEAQIPIEQ